MKKLSVLLISVLLFSCAKLPNKGSSNSANDSNQRIKAKVIRISCASTVIQVLDPAYYNLGETWSMQGDEKALDHVAVVANKCELPETLKAGDEFYFKIIPESEARKDCVVCMMYDAPPSKSILLKVVN